MVAQLHDERIDELLPGWGELFRADDRATPFQSPGWARAWWRHWGGPAKPWLLTVHDGDRLVGLAAMRLRSLPGVRLVQSGAEPGDYWDILAAPELRTEVEDAITRALREAARKWDVLVLDRLPPGSTTPEALDRSGLRTRERSSTPCPAIELPASFDDYLRTLPSSRRTNIRRRLRNLDEGELELRTPGVDELPAVLERWQALRIRQWEAMGKRLNREHTKPRLRDFLVDVTSELVPQGLALVWEFVRGGEVVGAFVNFCDQRSFYQYLGAFAPELGDLAIGKVATAEGIRSSIAAGRSVYDFTRGTEEYKYWYGAHDRPSASLLVNGTRARSGAAGRAAELAVRAGI